MTASVPNKARSTPNSRGGEVHPYQSGLVTDRVELQYLTDVLRLQAEKTLEDLFLFCCCFEDFNIYWNKLKKKENAIRVTI